VLERRWHTLQETDRPLGGADWIAPDDLLIWPRLAGRASNAEETARLLLDLMENDPCGFSSTLEQEAVKVMDKHALAAFERNPNASAFDHRRNTTLTPVRFQRKHQRKSRRRSVTVAKPAEVVGVVRSESRDIPRIKRPEALWGLSS
jgi:hypothetical protein